MLLFTVLGFSRPPHIIWSQSRFLCFYLQSSGLVTIPTCAPKVALYAAIYGTWALSPSPYMIGACVFTNVLERSRAPSNFTKPLFLLLFTVLEPHRPPHTCSQSRGLCFYLQYFVGGRKSCFYWPLWLIILTFLDTSRSYSLLFLSHLAHNPYLSWPLSLLILTFLDPSRP